MTNIILDVDPGYDDVVAIMLANLSDKLNVLGITVVAGNQSIDNNVENTLDICDYLNIDTPVFKGSSKPITRNQVIAKGKFSQTSLKNIKFNNVSKKIEMINAIDYIIDTINNSSTPITIVATGPLTNIALAIKKNQIFKKKLRE